MDRENEMECESARTRWCILLAKLKGTLLLRHMNIPVKQALKLMNYTTFTRHFLFRMWMFPLILKPSLVRELELKLSQFREKKKQNLMTCAKFNERALGLFEASEGIIACSSSCVN